MRSIKRVILADGSRLVREMLQRVIDQAEHLEVVGAVARREELPSAIQAFDPEWVIVAAPYRQPAYGWIDEHPSVRFIFLSAQENQIQMKGQGAPEDTYSDLSLRDLIHILEKDLQHT